ncbi:MAG TPA: hypothetical protein VG055_12805 [Planctomycetaceae bacterium]|jgi:hypothetical protein|nr:hypothetical protein [Planctomycetaceae bacterium]
MKTPVPNRNFRPGCAPTTQLNAQLQLWLNSAVLQTISINPEGREIRAHPYLWSKMVGAIQAHIPVVLKVCKEMDALTSQLRP